MSTVSSKTSVSTLTNLTLLLGNSSATLEMSCRNLARAAPIRIKVYNGPLVGLWVCSKSESGFAPITASSAVIPLDEENPVSR